MNQAIQIQDGFSFISASNALCIDAFVMGEVIKCYISLDHHDADTFYRDYQFDIEDKLIELLSAEHLIHDGKLFCAERDIVNY